MTTHNTNRARNRTRPNDSRSAQPTGQRMDQNHHGQWRRNYEHYCNLAQQANIGDAVTREQHWQHAEHFLRLMNGSAS